MDFFQFTSAFEDKLNRISKFELLESHYVAYSFGSGTIAYRIKGHNIKIHFDGKDGLAEILISPRHEKYPSDNWTSIFSGTPTDLINSGMDAVSNQLVS